MPDRARAMLVLLAGVLCLFAFEEGIHSVHHLPDYTEATACVVAACSSHAVGLTMAPITVGRPAPVVVERVFDATGPFVALLLARPQHSRAPPSSSPD